MLTLDELGADVDAGRDRHGDHGDHATCRAACRASACTPARSSTSIAEHGAEGCNYLLAVDVDMNTVPGYAMSSWERGYGDFVFMPDLATLRRIPWLDGTAMVQCDLALARRLARRRLAAPDPAAPARARCAERGWHA